MVSEDPPNPKNPDLHLRMVESVVVGHVSGMHMQGVAHLIVSEASARPASPHATTLVPPLKPRTGLAGLAVLVIFVPDET